MSESARRLPDWRLGTSPRRATAFHYGRGYCPGQSTELRRTPARAPAVTRASPESSPVIARTLSRHRVPSSVSDHHAASPGSAASAAARCVSSPAARALISWQRRRPARPLRAVRAIYFDAYVVRCASAASIICIIIVAHLRACPARAAARVRGAPALPALPTSAVRGRPLQVQHSRSSSSSSDGNTTATPDGSHHRAAAAAGHGQPRRGHGRRQPAAAERPRRATAQR